LSRDSAADGRALAAALARVRLLVLDVDGVLTDGTVLLDAEGRESKAFSVRDGAGIALLRRAGVEVALLSGREAACVAHRARELGIRECEQGVREKVAAFERLAARLGVAPEECAFVGDDMIDLPLMRRVGVAAAPADAAEEARRAARLVTAAPGGRGAVREVAEAILRAKGVWEKVVAEAFGG
jgi:3-deoxy-D-manno-octulosonate 8-phosphate phosphatase (KDO 8-P phosphatase)